MLSMHCVYMNTSIHNGRGIASAGMIYRCIYMTCISNK